MADSALRSILASFGVEFDGKNLEKGHGLVEGTIAKLGGIAPALAVAFGGHEIFSFTRELLEEADALAKQSQALGVSAGALQGWQWAAKLSGSSAEEFSAAYTKFNRNFSEAQKGTGPAAEALKDLGLTAEDIKGKLPIDALGDVAEGFKNIQDPGKRVNAAMALFGKAGARLIPMLQEGRDGTAALRAEVEELGFAYDEAFLANAQEVNDNVDRFGKGLRGLALQGIGAVLPGIKEFTKDAVTLVKNIIPIVKQSSAVKTALVALGIGGAYALAPLALSIAPIVAGFLALEDLFTFFSGGDSMVGRAIDGAFGSGSQEKVQQFVKSLTDSGITDALSLFKDAFAIFTDGKPLNVKFQELADYISGPFVTQMRKDFGVVGEELAVWLHVLTSIVQLLERVVELAAKAGQAVVETVGKDVFEMQDVAANDSARNAAILAKDPAKRATADDFKGGFVKQTLAALGLFDPQEAADALNAGIKKPVAPKMPAMQLPAIAMAAAVATAPIAAQQQPPPVITQENKTTIIQNFDQAKPDEVSRAAGDGAKAGVTKAVKTGAELLAAQGAIKKQG